MTEGSIQRKNVNLKYISLKDDSLDRVCLPLELPISVQSVKHYVLCLENMNAFFDKLKP